MIHEIIHGVEYGEKICGINGPDRIYNLANEVRTDLLAYSVLKECHNQKVDIFGNSLEGLRHSTKEENGIPYRILFPLAEDFFSTHQEFINTCAVHNDTDSLLHVLGFEFKDFNDMLKKTLNWILKMREDIGKLPFIEQTEESKKLIKTMSQNYEKRFSSYSKYE